MTKVLFVTSSAQGANSNSTKLGERLIARIPGAVVTRRDIGKNPPPRVDEASQEYMPPYGKCASEQFVICLVPGVGKSQQH
jgi:FMN-dependent NADH-azoreductase